VTSPPSPLTSAPEVLHRLLSAEGDTRESAWEKFLDLHSGLLLHVARSLGGDHDAMMDRYSYVITALRQNDFRRLRGYVPSAAGRFTTWLMVVVRRLCYDHHRVRYGRLQGESEGATENHRERRQLTDLIGDEIALGALPDRVEQGVDESLQADELKAALQNALARLEPSDRLVLRLRFEDGLSVPEITRLLRLESPFRLYRRIDRLLLELRTMLQAVGIRDPAP